MRVTPSISDSALLAAIADPVRLGILRQLTDIGACCACDIADNCPVSQPTVSHHLRVLREAGWLSSERRGTWIWYSIRPDALERFRRIGDSLTSATTDPSGPPSSRLPRLRVIQTGA